MVLVLRPTRAWLRTHDRPVQTDCPRFPVAPTTELYDGNPDVSHFPLTMFAVSLILALQLAKTMFCLLTM